MMIDKVHGLQSTNITLNERFTLLASASPLLAPVRQKKRLYMDQTFNYSNRNLVEEIVRQLDLESQQRALKQRLGGIQGRLRRFGSEGNLPGLRRANSFGNLTQASIKSRLSWRQNNIGFRNRSRSVSLGGGARVQRGFRRRGPSQRPLRGRFRGVGGGVGRMGRTGGTRGGVRGTGSARGRGGVRGTVNNRGNRGGMRAKPIPSKEELDAQLDQYMAGTRAALDKELDNYMKNAMDLDLII